MFNPLSFFSQKTIGRRDLGGQFSRYRSTIAWLYRNLIRYSKLRLVLAVGANVAGATLRGATLSLLVVYAGSMEKDRPFRFQDFQFSSRDPETFMIVVFALGLLLLLSSVLFYLGGRSIVKLSVDFAAHCSRLILSLGAARPPRNAPPSTNTYPNKVLARANGMLPTARAVQPLLQISNPATMMLYSLVALVYMSPLITAGLAGVVFLSLAVQYLINYHAVQNEKRLGRARKTARERLTNLLQDYAPVAGVYPSCERQLDREYLKKAICDQQRFFTFRMLASRKSSLVSDVVLSVSAIGLFILLGLDALKGETTWTLFLAYVIFSRILLVAIRGFLAGITGFARHYSAVRELYELLTSVEPAGGAVPDSLAVRKQGDHEFGDLKSLKFRSGQVLPVVSEVPVSRYNCYAFVDGLVGNDRKLGRTLLANCQWVSDCVETFPGGSAAELMGLTPTVAGKAIAKKLARLGFADLRIARKRLHRTTASNWLRLPVSLRCHILLSRVTNSPRGLIIVEHSVLDAADLSFVEKWMRQRNDSHILVRFPPQRSVVPGSSDAVLALARDTSTSLMRYAFYCEHRDDLDQWLALHQGKDADDSEIDDLE